MSIRFVAVGQDGLRLCSEDGAKWFAPQTGKEGETYRAVTFGNGAFVVVGTYGGENIFATTTDGQSWKTGKKEAKYVKYFRGLGFDGKQFLGIGGDPGSVGSSSPFVSTSTNGESWSDYTSIPGKQIIRRLAFGKGMIVGVGDRGRRSASNDGGKTWQDSPNTKAIDTLADVCFGRDCFVGVGLNGLRMRTTDGLTWSEPVRGEEGEHLNTVVWNGSQFVAIGFGATYFSPDGTQWVRKPNQSAPLTACFGGGVYLGTQWKGRLLLSRDAVTWAEVHKAEQHIEAVCFGG